MATLADLRTRVKAQLYGAFPTESPFVTQLAASYNPAATTVTILDENQWEVNDILENPNDGEQMLVVSVSSDSSDTLTVIRAWNGTTAGTSNGSDDPVFKNPRFPQQSIDQEIQNVIDDLEHWGIHVYSQSTVTRADPKEFYEVTEGDVVDPYGVLAVYYVENNTEIPRPIPFRYYQRLGTGPTEYTGEGAGIHILDWGDIANTEDAHFVYAQKIENPSSMFTRQEDLVIEGAVARLLGATVTPATHDPGARTDRTVPPGQTARDSRYFLGRFITAARTEAATLALERGRIIQKPVKFSRMSRWRA